MQGAPVRRAPVLPDQRGMQRLAGRALPQDGGFALVGHADGADVRCLQSGSGNGAARAVELALPDFLRVMFDPAWLGKMLLQRHLRHADRLAICGKNDGTRAGCALIEREKEGQAGFPGL